MVASITQYEAEQRVQDACKASKCKLVRKFIYSGVHKTRLQLKCDVDGHAWNVNFTNFVNSGSGCPVCGHRRQAEARQRDASYTHKTIQALCKTRRLQCEYTTGSYTRLKLTCGEGHVWTTSYNSFLRSKNACPHCAGRTKASTPTFIDKARKTHGNLYGYDQVKYVKWNTKVDITCKKHGVFQQTPHNHINGGGCPRCAFNSRAFKFKNVTIRGKVFNCQGYEEQALHWMVNGRKATPRQIMNGDNTPVILYERCGKTHRYYPDFYIPSQNRIVEVKSLWTMGVHKAVDSRNNYVLLLTKRQATLAAGFKFTLLVMDADGRKINLPQHWYKLTRKQLFKQLTS